jgi:hypothetical protein
MSVSAICGIAHNAPLPALSQASPNERHPYRCGVRRCNTATRLAIANEKALGSMRGRWRINPLAK